ncbi:MAG: hypothetical protein ACRDZX_16425 [Acidimicrobiales bacterium]
MGTVSSVLAEHVTLRVRCVDRLWIAGYVPQLAYEGGLVSFLLHRASLIGSRNIPSPALLTKNHDRMVAELDRLVEHLDLPVVRFKSKESKETLARPYQLAFATAAREGLVLVGKAQERVQVWAGYKDTSSAVGSAAHPHFSFSRQARVPDSWYFYLFDHEWGPAFFRLCSYAPYPLYLSANGHEWLKRQLEMRGVGYEDLDNGLRAVEDPGLAHRLAASLSAGHLQRLIARWLPLLPSPLIDVDRAAGSNWAFSVRQMEISDTAVFDRPQPGRAWFEAAIRDHLSLGRPDRVRIVFGRQVRSNTPGRFATQVITRGVYPRIEIRYKSSGAKAYFKHEHALRVETTLNNADDLDLKKTLNAQNWRALRHAGAQVNERFLQALGDGQPGLPDPATLQGVVMPSVHDGQRAPGLRFGDPRVVALFGALCAFDTVFNGLTNATLRAHMGALYDAGYTSAQATYDLRRLRLKGIIERVPGRHRYQVTTYGRFIATFFTRLATHVVVPTLSELDTLTRPSRRVPRSVAAAWRAFDNELHSLLRECELAA